MTNRPLSPADILTLPEGLSDFEGGWRLSRKIHDRHVGQFGHAEGRLEFSPDGDGLRYDESVTMHLPGQPPLSGTRAYLWRAMDGVIDVRFDTGAPFHQIMLGEPEPEATHHCAPDLYRVSYDFADWPVWTVTWEVSGPRKDYRMETLFVREKLRGG
ncbi:hypothetical protein ATO8_01245 [Roseivivax marinus]|uniref:DUF6314 domain-containing protein n=1 Tax=Roseivivax marinus TaxID=1379903 RepID=W4HP17_9RHOB|nr:DUF6314 family protein [Roseivivax marinus]ETW14492.1 hypothetical protein ATO8_01245 [Roseivivax marinus]UMA66273.1 DUF6314 family protein [Roseivivax marinus]